MNDCHEPLLISDEILKKAAEAELSLIPKKSEEIYKKEYDKFWQWLRAKNTEIVTEKVVLAYFLDQSKIYKSSSLWCLFSKLKCMLRIKDNIDISNFPKLTAFLKNYSVGYAPEKSAVFSKEQLIHFFVNAPNDKYLLMKVVAIFGLFGACRRAEFHNLCVGDVKEEGSVLVVYIRDTKTHRTRIFTILNDDGAVNYTDLIKKKKTYFSKKKSQTCTCEQIPFFPKYETKFLYKDQLRITWFGSAFSQSKYSYENCINGSNACTLIVIITAAKCCLNQIKIEEPDKPVNNNLISALASAMLVGNAIHQALQIEGVLYNVNLTVPEAIHYAGLNVRGIREWKCELYPQPLALTLYDNLKCQWKEWCQYRMKRKKSLDLYVVLISDSRSVIFVMQDEPDTVTLIDSHQHSQARGAFIATTNRNKLKILCHWFADLIYQCYGSYPRVYELAFLYFKTKMKGTGKCSYIK